MRFNSIRNRGDAYGDAYKVALKKSHFGKGPCLECAPGHIACQSEFAERCKMS